MVGRSLDYLRYGEPIQARGDLALASHAWLIAGKSQYVHALSRMRAAVSADTTAADMARFAAVLHRVSVR